MKQKTIFAGLAAGMATFSIFGFVTEIGDENSTLSPSPADSPFPLTTHLRSLQAGDTLEYTGSGTFTQQGKTENVTARLTYNTDFGLYRGNSVFTLWESISLLGADGEHSLKSGYMVTQDSSSGDLDVVAERTDGDMISPITGSQPVLFPGTFNDSLSATYPFSTPAFGNTGAHLKLNVTGTEVITVPAGTFATWNLTRAFDFHGGSLVYNSWFAPQVGNAVKTKIKRETNHGADGFDITVELTNTTFAF